MIKQLLCCTQRKGSFFLHSIKSPIWILLFSACSSSLPDYPVEFEPYVERFFAEASARGKKISGSKEDLIISLTDLPGDKGGKCTRSFFFPNRISIDKLIWQQMNDRQKELLLYHELGHCVLERDHRNDKFSQGECTSIMDGNEEEFFCSNNFYSEKWREYYLDELFDEQTLVPEWYVVQDLAEVETGDTLVSAPDSLWLKLGSKELYSILKFIQVDSLSDYLIEMTYTKDQRDTSLLSEEYGPFFTASFGEYEIAVLNEKNQSIGYSSSAGFKKDHFYRSIAENAIEFPLKFSLLVKDGWLTFFINGDQKHLFEENHYWLDPELSLRQKGRIYSIMAPAPNAHLVVVKVK